MSKPCEYCGTPVDEGDYQDDGYRHTDGRCTEYLKAALETANKQAKGMADLAVHLQSELDRERGRADRLREALHQACRHIRNGAPAAALSLIDATVGQP